MQNYTEIPSSQTLKNSLAPILNNDKTIMSCSSGATFPTVNLQIGMICYRTDQGKLYLLHETSPAVNWVFVADILKPSDKAYAPLAHVEDPDAHEGLFAPIGHVEDTQAHKGVLTPIAHTTDSKAHADIRALAEAAAGGLRPRGIVLSAITPLPTKILTHLEIKEAGTNYEVGDIVYISLPGRMEIPAWAAVFSVNAYGGVTLFDIINPGAFTDISKPSDAVIEQGKTFGTGLVVEAVFGAGTGLILDDITNPRQNDAAVVLHPDLASDENSIPWLWLYSDQNGDGVLNWNPGGGPMGAPMRPDGTSISFNEEGKLMVNSELFATIDWVNQILGGVEGEMVPKTALVNAVNISTTSGYITNTGIRFVRANGGYFDLWLSSINSSQCNCDCGCDGE
jgi:hypothetical protein